METNIRIDSNYVSIFVYLKYCLEEGNFFGGEEFIVVEFFIILI